MAGSSPKASPVSRVSFCVLWVDSVWLPVGAQGVFNEGGLGGWRGWSLGEVESWGHSRERFPGERGAHRKQELWRVSSKQTAFQKDRWLCAVDTGNSALCPVFAARITWPPPCPHLSLLKTVSLWVGPGGFEGGADNNRLTTYRDALQNDKSPNPGGFFFFFFFLNYKLVTVLGKWESPPLSLPSWSWEF